MNLGLYTFIVYTLITLILLFVIVTLILRERRLKKMHDHLSHQFDETALILESLDDGLLECDRDMVIIRLNHAAEKILGVEASQIVNRPVDEHGAAEGVDKLLSNVLFPPKQAIVGGGKSYSHDVIWGSPEKRKLRIYTIPKNDPKTKVLSGYIKIIRDVTLETVVQEHKTELVSIVSHQLLTPLTGIKWLAKSLLDGDGGSLNEKQAEMARRTLAAADQTVSLVTDILDVSKVEQAGFSYKKEVLDIIPAVRETIASRREKAEIHNVRLDGQFELASRTIAFDHERIDIALSNLIDNAIDYSPKGSTIEIRVKDNGTGVRIEVADHGIGIPEAEGQKLFSKFYRAENAKRVRTGGTGLGLYLARSIVEAHGGKISYISKQNEGTTFIVELPEGTPTPPAKSQNALV